MKTYLVGGAVRDRLLNYPHAEKDYVVVGSTPEEMVKQGFRPIGKDFPVFLHPTTHEEYALARTERKTGRGYTEFHFYASPDVTLEEDLKRRDLTINAMAMDDKNVLIDPYGGEKDLKNKLLKHVSEAFVEDPVRVLRTARFLARYAHLNFSIDKTTLKLMQTMVQNGEIDALVPDRVWQEMDRALGEKNPEKFFEVLQQCGAMEKLFPEIKKIKLSKNKSKLICFANLMQNADITSFCARYPVPSNYRDLAVLAEKYKHKNLKTPEEVLEFFEKSDAYRRPERFYDLLEILGKENLKELFEKTKNIENPKGFSGKAMGEAIHNIRLEKIREILHG